MHGWSYMLDILTLNGPWIHACTVVLLRWFRRNAWTSYGWLMQNGEMPSVVAKIFGTCALSWQRSGTWTLENQPLSWFQNKFDFLYTCCKDATGKQPLGKMCTAEKAMDESYTTPLPVPWAKRVNHDPALADWRGGVNGKSRFHGIDPWHMIHLGIGKSWIGSGVMLLQKTIGESNVDKRIAVISSEYKAFCKREGLDPILRRMDVHTFDGKTSDPNATWNKAAITSNSLLFLEDYMKRNAEVVLADHQLRVFVSFLNLIDTFPL